MYHRLSIQTSVDAEVRTFNDIEYLVLPVIALQEGVIHSANASEAAYVPLQEIISSAAGWNGRPITFNHPQVNGQYVSANSPEVLEEFQIGSIFNTVADDGKLKQEAWIDTSLLSNLDGGQEVLDAIDSGDMIEVSTGLFTSLLKVSGEFDGTPYGNIWDGIIPDHLAILSVGVTGACSIADGCGIPRINQEKELEMFVNSSNIPANNVKDEKKKNKKKKKKKKMVSTSACSCKLNAAARPGSILANAIDPDLLFHEVYEGARAPLMEVLNTSEFWIQGVTANHIIYEVWNGMWQSFRIAYTADSNGKVTLDSDPEQVRLLTKVIVQDGNIGEIMPNETPNDGDTSSTISTEDVNNVTASSASVTPPADVDTVLVAPTQDPVVNNEVTSIDDYLAGAPDEIKDILSEAMSTYNTLKAATVTDLVQRSNGALTDATLNALPLTTLQGMQSLGTASATQVSDSQDSSATAKNADTTVVNTTENVVNADFSGQAPATQVSNPSGVVEAPKSAFAALRANNE